MRADLRLLDNGVWAHMPTADEVAICVVAAAAAYDVHPLWVVRGLGPFPARHRAAIGEKRQQVKRARFVAAVLMAELLPDTTHASIARCLGVRGYKHYVTHAKDRRNEADWWDESRFQAALARVRDQRGQRG